jgi:hypothetical protein
VEIGLFSKNKKLWGMFDVLIFKKSDFYAYDFDAIKNEYNKKIGFFIKGFDKDKDMQALMKMLKYADYIFFETDGNTRSDLLIQYKELRMMASGFNVKIFCKIIGISAADLRKCVNELKYYNCDGLWFKNDITYKRISFSKYIKTYRNNEEIWVMDYPLDETDLPIFGYILSDKNISIDTLANIMGAKNV